MPVDHCCCSCRRKFVNRICPRCTGFVLTSNAFTQSTKPWENETLMWCSIEAGQILTMFPAYYVFNFLLTTLLILHLFWGYFIIKVAYKVRKETTAKTSFISSGDVGRRHSDGHKESVGKLQWLKWWWTFFVWQIQLLVPIWAITKKEINDVWASSLRPWRFP